MHARQRPYHLFEAHGIELEFMVVDRDSLDVRPLVARLFTEVAGAPVSDVSRGTMDWSNELTDHVVEVRNAKPAKRIAPLRKRFAAEVKALNKALARHDAILLPGGAHPWMDPVRETVLWAHEHKEIYATFDRLFGCRTHGWANSQSTHLNLSFAGDGEFTRLHAAVRLLLPIIPAIAASSPFLEGHATGFLDSRMEAYLHAQEQIPEMMGSLIPESVFDQEGYYREIYSPIAQVLARHDAAVTLDHEFANTRGAVARFDRGSVEIRVIDAQESPGADLAIAEFITVVLQALANGRWVSSYLQRAWPESDLLAIFLQVIKDAGRTVVANRDYLLMFGLMKQEQMSAAKIWQHLFVELYEELSEDARTHVGLILEHGCLASRILRHTGPKPDRDRLRTVYRQLAGCLLDDRPFL